MSSTTQSQEIPTPAPEGRTWRQYFPKGDLWVFGYGSLIWKPPPHYAPYYSFCAEKIGPANGFDMVLDQRVPGYIEGYVRRFWQASTDHRGTPEQPGRVVTVIERGFWETLDDPLAHLDKDTTRVWGAAYHISPSHASEVHDYLDVREIDGYSVHYTPFHPKSESGSGAEPESPITCMVYIGQPSNPQFLREPSTREPQAVAEVIARGVGASGKNTEYLYLLEKALEGVGLGSADGHVTDLVGRVRELEGGVDAEREEEKAERDVKVSLAQGEDVRGAGEGDLKGDE